MSVSSAISQTRSTHSTEQEKLLPRKAGDETSMTQPSSVLADDEKSETATIFEAFKQIDLDLTLSLSARSSPAVLATEDPLSDFASSLLSPPSCLPSSSTLADAAPPFHDLHRTISLSSPLTPLSPLIKTKQKIRPAKFSDQSSIFRGTWPAIKYVGRGTPVDKNKRKEWSGISSENVAEDGVLFSDLRPASLDSPRISSSSEWDFLNTGLPISGSSVSGRGSTSLHRHSIVENGEQEQEDRVPPLQKIDIELESETENWASVMETVLSSAEKGTEEEPTANAAVEEVVQDFRESKTTGGATSGPVAEQLPPEVIDRVKSELQFDVNIDKALDLGFSPAVNGGDTFFTVAAAIPDSDPSNLTIRRTTTGSSRSQYSTPSEGPSDGRRTTFLTPESTTPAQETMKILPDVKSTTSTKAPPQNGPKLLSKRKIGMSWWKKTLERIKRMVLLRTHQTRC